MIGYSKYIRANGLTVVLHEAWDTPLATVNLLYNVGSRDEDPQRTGFAHLFEHLMFGGTERVPDYDAVVSSLGGENNAFTNTDYTNYYITLPADSLAEALALEADRMEGLRLTPKALEVQQQVVTEEYRQRYMNQPYGDVWLLLRPLCFRSHPYRWATIGADIAHVGEATLQEVMDFHRRFYRADNAVLAVAAPLSVAEMLREVEKAWHCKAVSDNETGRRFAQECEYCAEPQQREPRRLEVQRDVPVDAVYMAWPCAGRFDKGFRECDLLSDVLSTGKSSRLEQRLVREMGLATEVDACITGDAGPGMLMLSARLADGVDADTVAEALRNEVRNLTATEVAPGDLDKVLNRYESTFAFSQYKAADRALGLCYYSWLGDTALVNTEPDLYRQVSPASLLEAARNTFVPERENLLIVRKKES